MLRQLRQPFQYEKLDIENQTTFPQKGKKRHPRSMLKTIKRIWNYLSFYKPRLIAVFVMVVISSCLGLLGPFLLGKAIDNYIVTKESHGLAFLLLELIGVYILYSGVVWLQNIVMVGIAQNTVFRMRTDTFRHFHKLPISYFDKRQYGELMSRVTNDIDNISSTLNDSVIQIFSSGIMLIGTLVVMIGLSPLLTLVTMIIVPIMFLGMRWITNHTSKFFKVQQRNLGNLNGYIEETISGQSIVKTFSQEQRAIDEFIEKSKNLRQSGFWAQTYSGFIPKLMNGLNNLSFSIVAAVGGILAFNNIITIGVIVIFAEYTRQFTRPLNDLSNQFNTLLSAIAGAERVFEVLDEEEEIKDEKGATEIGEIKGEVVYDQVSFSYEKDGSTLNNVSFKADPGEMVALVGPTGAGKTTIINLLARFYTIDSGKILVDGQDISKIKRESLRAKMGFVLQDSFLFQGTVRENIRYGRLDATDEEVEEAAHAANAYSFIMKLPQKFDTILEQNGGGISQGQKQLLSIARAILAKPAILILDEATSSIDTITEVKIQEALGRLMTGRTSFVIAHRLNTIQKADQILVLGDGEIIEKGSHQELLAQKGAYADLYHSQLSRNIG